MDSDGNGMWSKMFPAKYLDSLYVRSCVNFTTPALVDVIRFRADAHWHTAPLAFEFNMDRPLFISSIYSLVVDRRGPALTQEAMDWFYNNKEDIDMIWHAEDD